MTLGRNLTQAGASRNPEMHTGNVDRWVSGVIAWGIRELFTFGKPWRQVEADVHKVVDAHGGDSGLRNKIGTDIVFGYFAQIMYRHARAVAQEGVRNGKVLRPSERPIYVRNTRKTKEVIVPLFDDEPSMDRAQRMVTMLCLNAADTVFDTAGHRGPPITDRKNPFHDPWLTLESGLADRESGNAAFGIATLPIDQVYQTTEFGRQLIEAAGDRLTDAEQCRLAFRHSARALSVAATHEGPEFHFRLGLPTYLARQYRDKLLEDGMSPEEIEAIPTGVYIDEWRKVGGIEVPVGKIRGIETSGAPNFDSKCSGRMPMVAPTERRPESAIKIVADIVHILLPYTLLHGDSRSQTVPPVSEVTCDALGLSAGVIVGEAERRVAPGFVLPDR